jgi:hypothetical protein
MNMETTGGVRSGRWHQARTTEDSQVHPHGRVSKHWLNQASTIRTGTIQDVLRRGLLPSMHWDTSELQLGENAGR